MESERYRVTVAGDGSISSLTDLASGRDLVRPGGAISHKGPAGDAPVEVEARGPVRTTLRVTAPGAPRHIARISLVAGVDRVEVDNRITANFGAVTGYDFDFALGPDFVARHEEVGMVAKVGRGANGDYAERGTRTDYLTLNHFVDLAEPRFGVTLSSWDSQFFRLGESTIQRLDTAVPSVFAVVGMQSDGADVAFQNQGGDEAFKNRYALRAHRGYDGPAAMRFALAHQNPLVAVAASGGADAPLSADTFSLLRTREADVLLWALKPAEEGIEAGAIVRLWNLAEAPRNPRLFFPGARLRSAVRATHVETDIGEAERNGDCIEDGLARQQLGTWRVQLALSPGGGPAPDGGVQDVDAAPPADAAPSPGDAAAPDPGRLPDARGVDRGVACVRPDAQVGVTDGGPPTSGEPAPPSASKKSDDGCAVGGTGPAPLGWVCLLMGLRRRRRASW